MELTSSAVVNGFLLDKYGKRGHDFLNGMPTRSFPFTIENAPRETISYALVFDDPDAQPVCGYTWVHWLAANIRGSSIGEDASRQSKGSFLQGINSWNEAWSCCYGGPSPPDRTHTYVLSVWALDCELQLKNGFTKQQLMEAMKNHMLDSAVLTAKYRP